ncbi:MAG: ankyrin repeat domain-containing protein [Verrucomicrobiota bacterium]
MKLFLLSIFFPLAVTLTVRAEASTPSERKLIKAIREDAPKPVKAHIDFNKDPNTVIDGDTLLHHAALYGSNKVVESLLKSGADPMRMNASMEYPIEVAIRHDAKEIIKLLSRPEDKRKPEDVTTDLLYRLVAGSYPTSDEGDKKTPPVFVRLNGNDPSGAQMDRLRSLGKQFALFSEIPLNPDEQPKKARAGKLAEIETLYISIKPSANGFGFDWSLSISPGPLTGRGSEGNCLQQHGYWIVETTKRWVS